MSRVLIQHFSDGCKFVASLNGAKAVLNYKKLPKNVIDIYHTEVPVEFRGKGIAKQLCDSAFAYAAKNNLFVKPSCSYALKYASNASKEFKDIVIWPHA
uniref:Protein NATD1 n=1 Tax=Syphacia muris TaxID=451379 RepID=A0A0N5ABD5_9BILA